MEGIKDCSGLLSAGSSEAPLHTAVPVTALMHTQQSHCLAIQHDAVKQACLKVSEATVEVHSHALSVLNCECRGDDAV